jgi:hypothetical protein
MFFATAIATRAEEEPPTPRRRQGNVAWPLEIAANGRVFIPENRVARIGVGNVRRRGRRF